VIALWCRHNGQWLATVIGPRSVRCTVFSDDAATFATEDEAHAFLRLHGLAVYFEPRPSSRSCLKSS
jgi:hypothetical protein